ncbi:MAG: nitrilase-related carbon-nitrogen hydrolase, partial [Acidiferrobacterales bacterium]
GSLAGQYRKMHIPHDPGYYEKYYFTPGNTGFMPIQTHVGKLGVLVCWDQWFPEAARLMALNGADILLYPTAIGWDVADDKEEKQRQLDSWQVIQRSHAIANSLPLLCANRCGHEANPGGQTPGIDFWGNSFIAGPQGEVLAGASADNAETLVAALDMNRSEQVKRIWPFFRDRRVDAYADLIRRDLNKPIPETENK